MAEAAPGVGLASDDRLVLLGVVVDVTTLPLLIPVMLLRL